MDKSNYLRDLTPDEFQKLLDLALEARNYSYSPYSKFRVGAALLTDDGKWYQGCNVENASYGGAICAERTVYVKAVSEGHKKFLALAVSSDQDSFISPCGICRQFISEFGSKVMPVYLVNPDKSFKEVTVEKLLPYAFGRDDMPNAIDS